MSEQAEVKGASIYALIPKITGEVAPIAKERKNQQQGYSFRGVEDVYATLNLLLARNGVSIVPEVIHAEHESYDNKNGTKMFRSRLLVRYHLSAADGSTVTATVAGEGMDSGDKAIPKALSVAYKYMAFQVFCIPTNEKIDVEEDSPTVPAGEKPRKPKAAAVTVVDTSPAPAVSPALQRVLDALAEHGPFDNAIHVTKWSEKNRAILESLTAAERERAKEIAKSKIKSAPGAQEKAS